MILQKAVATDNFGFILDVDLMYPVYLHESHNDYPLAAEKCKITQDMLTPYSKSLINKHSSTEKLAPNQKDKINYALHYENLRLYLELEIIQQNETKLRHPFYKTCSNCLHTACLAEQWNTLEIEST